MAYPNAAPSAPVQSPWLAMDEAAAYLKYRTEKAAITVRTVLVKNSIPLYRRNNKHLLVRREDLDEWIETGDCARGRQRQIDAIRNAAKLRAKRKVELAIVKPRRGRPPKTREAKAIRELEEAERVLIERPFPVPPWAERDEEPEPDIITAAKPGSTGAARAEEVQCE